ncbi:DUF5947 family protein [Paractinoplanes atraurantiacus]|uniref:Uncharacterized protein n=1 Tax=Paractinoplanes atraurantiacus TaxID=1036182 RepID=A0A285J388_9ACTN|nr:DUF5947 family protein [Actinoplanes atraurantiacus]SNY54785.1 hypothetical protein SAMN05421748_115157 [Actinoplanes atraurantiacus]
MTGPPLAALRRIVRQRPAAAGERCEMCAEPIGAGHGHLVDRETRRLICGCRPCYLLFTDPAARQRYRSVPSRYLSFAGPLELDIPVGLAFLFHNSALGRVVALYPGPAGATESELPLSFHDPRLDLLVPDVEALLLYGDTCHLVPIDACYGLAGRLRDCWRGFDGGAEARAVLGEFFAGVRERSRPA